MISIGYHASGIVSRTLDRHMVPRDRHVGMMAKFLRDLGHLGHKGEGIDEIVEHEGSTEGTIGLNEHKVTLVPSFGVSLWIRTSPLGCVTVTARVR